MAPTATTTSSDHLANDSAQAIVSVKEVDHQTSRHRSNSLVVSSLLNSGHNLSTAVMQTVLDLINHPDFDKSAVTLKSYSDVFAYDTSMRASASSKRSCFASSLRNFPPVVLDNVLDMIESDRVQASQFHRTVDDEFDRLSDDNDPVSTCLGNMSLVHRSWTWPAQKAIGREIRITEHTALQSIRKALSSVLFGPWTKRASIQITRRTFRFFRSRTIPRVDLITAKAEYDSELASLLVELLKKIPRVRQVSLKLSWASGSTTTQAELFSTVFTQVASLKQLRSLAISSTFPSETHVFNRLLTHLVAAIPTLECLGICTCFNVHSYGDQTPQLHNSAALSALPPPTNLKELSIDINYGTSPKLLDWLFRASQVQILNLHVQGHHESMSTLDADVTLSALITAMNPSRSFASLHTLCLSSNLVAPLRECEIVGILRDCAALQTFRLLPIHWLNVETIIRSLPYTLTSFYFSPQLVIDNDDSDNSIDSFDASISSWLSNPSFRTSHPLLRLISLSITYAVNVPAMQWDVNPEDPPGIETPTFKLARTTDACDVNGVELQVKWNRSLIPTYPPHPFTPPFAQGIMPVVDAAVNMPAQLDVAPLVGLEPIADINQVVGHGVAAADGENADDNQFLAWPQAGLDPAPPDPFHLDPHQVWPLANPDAATEATLNAGDIQLNDTGANVVNNGPVDAVDSSEN